MKKLDKNLILKKIEGVREDIKLTLKMIESERRDGTNNYDKVIIEQLEQKKLFLMQKVQALQTALRESLDGIAITGKCFVVEVNGYKKELCLVRPELADSKMGHLPTDSPLALALIQKNPGEEIEVDTPGGQQTFRILNIL